ncbi:MAG: phosphoribosylformylglycinamidine cyclo-ligase [Candidatus Saccharibacteria bacterium]|nr:phosphoribosylformylglycinamidine cyclo-ligase [Candidatus Saccharibacteria bacterium]
MTQKLDYHQSVNYDQADPMKVLAQQEGLATKGNMPAGFAEVEGTRGESAYMFSMSDKWGAFVQEGLGTKSLIAQSMYESTGKSLFAGIAQDTVACIINDLVSVGATPVVLNAYWSASSYEWLTDKALAEGFIKGWRAACDKAGVVWGGGETQALSGVVVPGALEFAGSAFGIITDEEHLVQGKNLQAGDAIVLVESNGVHANGISLIRELAARLPEGYATELSDGTSFGEAALAASHLYAELVQALQVAELNIHYLSNITGHGWRKIMRAEVDFTYRMTEITPVAPIFDFIAEQAQNDEREMYGNYNMGAGYAVYLPANQAEHAVQVAKSCGLQAWIAGTVEAGPKQVIIEPKNITFAGDTLEVR